MGRMSRAGTVAEGAPPASGTTPAPSLAGVRADGGGAAPLDPMRLWRRLQRTDPKHTKPFTRPGGFRGTQIDPTWRMQTMTEVFGPVGQGWGWEQLDWTLAERMVFICVRVWYRDPDSGAMAWTGPQWGGTTMVRRRSGLDELDDECFKMSMTDAVGKCLVQIGLAADVHLGQFDDSKYREESEAFYAAKANPELAPAAIAAFEAEVRHRLVAVLDLEDLEELWRAGVSTRLREIGTVDRTARQRITELFAAKKAEILTAEEAGESEGKAPREAA
jgi:hypothetical protein